MIKREEYLKIYENGLSHIECARTLAEKNKFGFATSHLVLGLEELIKYQVVQIHSSDDTIFSEKETKSTSSDSIFRRHKTKHKLLKEFQEAISESFAENFVEYIFYKTTGKDLEVKHKIVEKNRFKEIGSLLGIAFSEINIEDEEKGNFFKWLGDADNLKNDGFYVDMDNSSFKTPDDLKRNTYETALKYTNAVLEQTKVIKDLDITDDEFTNLLNSDFTSLTKQAQKKEE